MRVTIKDVSKKAGVSVTSATYAINGTGSVSAKKKEIILKVADELGYVPSGIARSLRNKKTDFVGYFSYSLSSGPVFSDLTKGIEDYFNKNNQEMLACCSSPYTTKITRLLNERMVDGAIIMSEYIPDELILKIACKDFPVIVLDRDLYAENISCILVDNFGSSYNVGKYIKDKGLKNVGCILGSGFDGRERKKGFFKAIEDFNLNIQKNWILNGNFQAKTAYDETVNLIKSKNLPEVIFCISDEMAIACIQAFQASGYKIPNDICIIGMDDIPLASFISPKLTTIHRPIYELGELAAETLYNMMYKNQKSVKKILSTNLIERESCI